MVKVSIRDWGMHDVTEGPHKPGTNVCVVVGGSETWLSVVCATHQHLHSLPVSSLKSTKAWCTNRIQKSRMSSYFCIASTELSVSIIVRETLARNTNSSPVIVTNNKHIHKVTIQTPSFWPCHKVQKASTNAQFPLSQQTDACIFSPTWMNIFYCCFASCHGEKETCFVRLLPCRCAVATAALHTDHGVWNQDFWTIMAKKNFYQPNFQHQLLFLTMIKTISELSMLVKILFIFRLMNRPHFYIKMW